MKYKIGDLLEIKYDMYVVNTKLAIYKSEYVKAGQLFLIIDCFANTYIIFSQESGNNSAWAKMNMNYNFKKVL